MTEANNHQYNLIQQYLNGTLDPERMHELEKEALEDPFLAEALEGYATFDGSVQPHLSLLQRQLEERIAESAEKKNMFFFTWQRLSVAAAASLLFVSASILFWMKGTNNDNKIAANPKKVEVSLTPDDRLGREDQEVTGSADTKEAPVSTQALVASQPPLRETKVQAKVIVPAAVQTDQDLSLAGRVTAKAPESEHSGYRATVSRTNESIPTETLIASAKQTPGEVRIVEYGQTQSVAPASYSYKVVNRSTTRSVAQINEPGSLDAQPVDGWKSFEEYIRTNKRLPAPAAEQGAVLLTFTIDAIGRPDTIRIEQSINPQYDAEAIRLLKDGPLWRFNRTARKPTARVKVDFKN